MQRLRKWMTTIINHPKTPIPPLPDEILVNIFSFLSPEDRLTLRLVCKRFRDLEFQKGDRKCDCITVIMLPDNVAIVAKLYCANSYTFEAGADGDFEATTPGISEFFKGATADSLNFIVAENREQYPSPALISLLDLISYKDLYFYLYCKSEFSGFIVSFFEHFKNEHLNNATFVWHSLNGQNVTRLQEAMSLLPKFNCLCVYEDKNANTKDFVLNGPLMVAVLRTAPEIQLKSINCTTQDLLTAFKMVLEYCVHEYVVLFVVHSAADNLLPVAQEQGFLIDQDRRIMDYTRCYAMRTTGEIDDSGRCRRVEIYRIDADGNRIKSSD